VYKCVPNVVKIRDAPATSLSAKRIRVPDAAKTKLKRRETAAG
jgi:hypothetical protein